MENKNLKFLDAIRGLTALYVLIHHARLVLMQPFYEGFLKNKTLYSTFDKFMIYKLSIFKFGDAAVIIFIVLSGFVIHLKQAQNPNKPLAKLTFYKKRIRRIYPTLIAAMVVTWLMASLVTHYTNLKQENYQWINAIGNISLIPALPLWGNNYPIWSLKHEWMFYLFYPLLLVWHKRSKFTVTIVPIIGFTLALNNILIPILLEVTYTLLIWWIGILLAEAYVHSNKRYLKFTPLLIFPGIAMLCFQLFDKSEWRRLGTSLITAGVLAYMLQRSQQVLNKLAVLGTFSYSLYLVHFPIQMAIKSIYIHYHKALPHHLLLFMAGIVVPLLLTYPVYYFTERKKATKLTPV